MSLSLRLVFFFSAFALFAILSGIQARAMDINTANAVVGQSIRDAAGLKNDVKVELIKGASTIEQLSSESLSVTKLDFDINTGMFLAYVSANEALPFTVAGRFYEFTKVPVLSRKFGKNEIIAQTDIAYLEIESTKLKNGYITNEQQLIGKAPIRTIQKARPVIESQLTTPKVIERSKQVTMIYKNNILSIKDSGIALESGAIGDIIKFKNINSGRVVHAKVIDAATAEVRSASSELASN